jgi:hypothetical protein
VAPFEEVVHSWREVATSLSTLLSHVAPELSLVRGGSHMPHTYLSLPLQVVCPPSLRNAPLLLYKEAFAPFVKLEIGAWRNSCRIVVVILLY